MKIASRVLTALAIALFLTACSGDESDGNAAGKTAPAGKPPSEQPAKKKVEPPEDSLAVKAFDLRMKGESKRAQGILELSSLVAEERNAYDLFELARANYWMLKRKPAYEAARDAAKLEEDNARFQYWYGVMAYEYNSSQYYIDDAFIPEVTVEAFEALEKAVALDPDFHEARFLLIKLYRRLRPEDGGDSARAEALAADLGARDPGWGILAEGHALKPGLKWEDVRKKAEERLAGKPNDLGALLALFESLLKDRIPEGTAELADRIVALDPSRSYVYLNIARQFSRPEHEEQSTEMVRKYLETPGLTPAETAMAYATMAALLAKNEDRNLTKEWMAKAKKIDPDCWKALKPPLMEAFRPPYD